MWRLSDYPKKNKWDSPVFGLIAGLVIPVIAMECYHRLNFGYMTYRKFTLFIKLGRLFADILSLCVIADLAAFLILMWLNMVQSSRGVMIATLIYAGIIAALNIF